MAVRIRLRRMGARKQPQYRVVVADSRSPRDGRFLDTIGTYNPRIEPADIRIDADKALAWLEKGATPTDSARSLLSQVGIWQRFRTGAWPEAGAGAAAPAQEAPPVAAEEPAEVEEPVAAAEPADEAAPEATEPEEEV